MILRRYTQDPDASLSYAIDWADWLASGDSLSTAVWAEEQGDGEATLSGDAISGTQTVVTVSTLTAGVTYVLRVRVTTSGGLIEDRSIEILAQPAPAVLARLADFKDALNTTSTDLDGVLTAILQRSTARAEQLVGRPLVRQVGRVEYPRQYGPPSSRLVLDLPPIESVSRVVQLYAHGTTAEFAAADALIADDEYHIADAQLGVLERINAWWYTPRTVGYSGGRLLQVTYTGGYCPPDAPVSGAALPGEALQQGILLDALQLYGQRNMGQAIAGDDAASVRPHPALVEACQALRRVML